MENENVNEVETNEVDELKAKIEELEAQNKKLSDIAEKNKEAQSKASSQAAEYKKQLMAKQTDEEKRQAEEERRQVEEAEAREKLQKELEEYKTREQTATYKSSYLALGYSEELATKKAECMVAGDIDGANEVEKKHLDKIKTDTEANNMRNTGRPAGGGGKTLTKADIMAIKNTAERQKAIAENISLFE